MLSLKNKKEKQRKTQKLPGQKQYSKNVNWDIIKYQLLWLKQGLTQTTKETLSTISQKKYWGAYSRWEPFQATED